MEISAKQVKELRDKTGISVMECRKALEQAMGDTEKAQAFLRERSKDMALKKSGRTLAAGVVASYIHANGNIGAMVELSCETDFVAKNEEFKKAAHEIAMQVAATNPEALSVEELGEGDKGVASERALLEQPFIKDSTKTIRDLVNELVQKFGEKTEVRRFVRFSNAE